MKAAYIHAYGAIDKVQVGDINKPIIGPDDVLIKMKAASVNPIDWKMAQGDIKALFKLKFPVILGNDGAGVISEVGSSISNFSIGDEVFFRCHKSATGTYAEYFSIPANLVAKKPGNMSFEQAASIPLVGLTSYQALKEKAKMTAGSKVLIHAGSGGVGTFAVQLAKACGAYVATTASKRHHELLKALGADEIIDYRTQNFESELTGYDIVFNTLGDTVQEASYKVLKENGISVSILGIPDPTTVAGLTSNIFVKLASRLNFWKNKRQAKKFNAQYKHLLMYADGKQLSEIARLIEENKITAVIDSSFPLERIVDAFQYSASGHVQGKIIITI